MIHLRSEIEFTIALENNIFKEIFGDYTETLVLLDFLFAL